MNIGEILIWEATNVLLLIPLVIALVILTRSIITNLRREQTFQGRQREDKADRPRGQD
jgi:hypothetical protein